MNRNNLPQLLVEKEQELKLMRVKLEKFVSIQDKIVEEEMTGFDLIKHSKTNDFPLIVIKEINLEHIGNSKIREDISGYGQQLLNRLRELINMYQGSALYLEDEISQLSKYLNGSD